MTLSYQVKEDEPQVTIYYEDDCGFCLQASTFVVTVLGISRITKIIPASTNKEAYTLLKENNSWVVERNASYYLEYDAFLSLLQLSPWFSYLYYFFACPFSKWVGKKLYRLIGNHRPTICLQ